MAGIGDKVRALAFWQMDLLKGGKLRSHFNDVQQQVEHYSGTKSNQQHGAYLKTLLKHVCESVPYYNGIESTTLTDFPVVNKLLIRDNDAQFVSSNESYQEFKSVVTSGSTGTPFSIKQDLRKSIRNTSDTIYFGKLAGFDIGQKLFYFKIWNKVNQKGSLLQKMQNIVPIDVSILDDETLPQIVKALQKDKSAKALLAYSSVYDAIAFYMQKNELKPLNHNVKAIIAMSEAFSKASRELISKYLNANAVSRYSNMENGIIAQQLNDGSDEFLINNASYHVEILDLDSDKPVAYGEAGRIVITDLFNFCMPLIRYDTGDIGVLDQKEVFGDIRPVFKSIEGRKMDLIYDTSGSLMSSYIVTNNLWKYKEVKQYQFIQNSETDYKFLLNLDGEFSRAEELKEEFAAYLGEGAKVEIEYVDEIPVLSSGKRKKVLNNFTNK
ncbi:hypothetical protein [Carboxylicivirga sp. N1Y90]|uniref:hypothetical protein n=1 Tax=Carboxylicivirga fragile TaxID=3417571 RepID=UPI003D347D5C|nr:phenylacetate--CoA ligase family protein [Marinilabiliaceae bacterium N1Y90]